MIEWLPKRAKLRRLRDAQRSLELAQSDVTNARNALAEAEARVTRANLALLSAKLEVRKREEELSESKPIR